MTALASQPRETRIELPVISLILPMYNERDVLTLCLERIDAVMADVDLSFEAVFVDDGSEDGSDAYLIEQCERFSWVRLVRLSRNFGKEAALTAGLDHALGEAMIILDTDLQDPPEYIPEMIDRWRDGADVVLMQRRSRAGETWLKRVSSHLYYRLLQRMSRSEIPADTGDFRLMSRRAVDALRQLTERNRYMKGLFAWVGMPTVVILYDRASRAAGKTKWNYLGLFGLALEGITSFSVSPLRWAALAGVVAAMLGGGFGLWIIFKALIFGEDVRGYASLISLITFLGGVQLLTIGIVGEYLGKAYLEAKRRPIYLVRDVVDRTSTQRASLLRPDIQDSTRSSHARTR